MTLPRWLRYFLDLFPHQDDGLIKPGNWRVVYPDGRKSRGVMINHAHELAERHGGEVYWIDRKHRWAKTAPDPRLPSTWYRTCVRCGCADDGGLAAMDCPGEKS